jgi:hypothetical protein
MTTIVIQAYRRTITHSPNSIDETGTTLQLEPFTSALCEVGYQGYDEPISVALSEGWDLWESEGTLFIAPNDPRSLAYYSLTEALDFGVAEIIS